MNEADKNRKYLSLEERKKISLQILNYVDQWCHDNKVSYYLGFGTLLGAVRHKGMIPWDDDVDIFMKRADYNCFIEKFNTTATDKNYKCISFEDGTFLLPYTKVVDLRTRLEDQCFSREGILGMSIDIFPLDLAPAKKDIHALSKKMLITKKLLRYSLFPDISVCDGEANAFRKKVMYRFSKMVGYDRWAHRVKSILSKCNQDQGKYYLQADTMMYLYDASWYEETVQLPFESKLFPAPKHYDEVLRAAYGDYMQLPPENQRIAHAHPVYYVS